MEAARGGDFGGDELSQLGKLKSGTGHADWMGRGVSFVSFRSISCCSVEEEEAGWVGSTQSFEDQGSIVTTGKEGEKCLL